MYRTGIKITCNLPPAGAFPSSPHPQVFNELDVSHAKASVEATESAFWTTSDPTLAT